MVVTTRDIVPAVLSASRCLPRRMVLALRPLVARLLAIPLERQVERRMIAALGTRSVSPAAVRAYFEHVADLVAFSILTMRHGFGAAGLDTCFEADDSVAFMESALDRGRGALLISPHLVCHEIASAWANRRRPLTAIIRHSSDPSHEERKVSWYRAAGIEVVYRPNGGGSEMREMSAALRALRENRMLAVTPDLLQEPGRGIEVTLFGRTACLPPGPAFLASRTGAPFVPCFFWKEGDRYRLAAEEPIEAPGRGDRETVTRGMMQEWCRRFEAFLRRRPDMWLFWLDRRWARWLLPASE